ncbi:polyketide synthase dehydratase domain-containing protein [Williamsia sp. CHRR-6]|nr:polyketide synthase dehydratase domain-containing protein [Williamsia sp. CHRR-6]
MSVMFPAAPDLDSYWANIIGAVDAITDAPAHRWDESYATNIDCRRGGFVDDLAEVDILSHGIMPASVGSIEPDQLIALKVAAAALADAGGERAIPADRTRAGVILGRGGYLTPGMARLDQRVRTASQLVHTLGELVPGLDREQLEAVRTAFTDKLGPEAPESAIGLVPNLAASRLANRLDLRGPAYTVDAACASSLIAVHNAVRELSCGALDVVLAGGVHHCHDVTLWSVFSQLGALSKTDRIRPLHRDADGVLIGEGTGIVVLKRLSDAQRDGDRVYAVITGTGMSSDGRVAALATPDSSGQVRAVRAAWDAAGLDPSAPDVIGLLEAHGTATPAGDSAELTTLAEVFGRPNDATAPAIGSVKSMIGHTMPAAGVAGLIKAALAVHHGIIPPTLHCDEPNPTLAQTRFAPAQATAAWTGDTIRRAGVNAFGFGGINAHVVIEQSPEQFAARTVHHPISVTEPDVMLLLAADTHDELAARLDHDDSEIRSLTPGSGDVRIAIGDPTAKRLATARKVIARGKRWHGRNDLWFAPQPLLRGGELAFVYAGLDADFDADAADLAHRLGLPWIDSDAQVGDVARHGLAVMRLGRLLTDALDLVGVHPDAVAGHSIGEWNAMVTAEIFDRAEIDAFMGDFDPDQLDVPGVAFAVVGASVDEVAQVIANRPGVVVSHDNAPRQSIICGPEATIADLVDGFRAKAVISSVLPFRSGFHTPMFEPFMARFVDNSAQLSVRSARLPMWSATTLAPYPADHAGMHEVFVRHLLEPVRFRGMVQAMHDSGIRGFVQIGDGQLGSLIGDSLAERDHVVFTTHSPQRGVLAQLQRICAALWVEGRASAPFPIARTGSSPATAAPARRLTKLDLGSGLISIEPADRPQLLPPTPIAPAPIAPAPIPAAPRTPLPQTVPVASVNAGPSALGSEFSAFVAESTATANSLIEALRARRANPVAPRPVSRPAPRGVRGRRAVASPSTPAQQVRSVLRIDVQAMPYLMDHCFFRQPSGWPYAEDSWPVVPATTSLQHMIDAAGSTVATLRPEGGLFPVSLTKTRMMRWITAIPSTDVPVRVDVPELPAAVAAAEIAVALEGYAAGTVSVATAYPQAPAVWPHPSEPDVEPQITAEQMYSQHWMFHGPQFQAMVGPTRIGARHIWGAVVVPQAPGALLDNVGQLMGHWITSEHPERTVMFPVGFERIDFYCATPPVGTRLQVGVRITEVTHQVVRADAQLVTPAGEVFAQITGWEDRRFDSPARVRTSDRYPGAATLSHAMPGEWMACFEQWPDLATRELIMRNMLGEPERVVYDKRPPRGKRQWLLGRIAAKDALRQLIWGAPTPSDEADEIYPAELVVGNDEVGRPHITARRDRALPAHTVSIAHTHEVGVAIARPWPCGIDVAVVEPHPQSTLDLALAPAEQELLAGVVAGDATVADLWFARFWAAKEAVAKAAGTGLGGAPQRFAVIAAPAEDQLVVRHDGVEHTVRLHRMNNPADLPQRDYVVAFTERER